MLVHADLHDPILINTIGHTAGLLLFGLIVILLIRDGRIRGVHQIKLPGAPLPLLRCGSSGVPLGTPISSLMKFVIVLSYSWRAPSSFS